MCIRDRVYLLLALFNASMVAVDKKLFSSEEKLPPLSKLTSVSYTHLRAHETVLEIVCRLLLEKKNKTSNNTHHRLMNANLHKKQIALTKHTL